MIMIKHFVTFLSPGTFVNEETERPIDSWDANKASEMAHDIIERHGSRPFGFQFSTRERKDDELDSKVTKISGIYFLGGVILTVADVEKMNNKQKEKYDILLANMRSNKWDRVVMNDNSYRIFQPLNADDTLLDFKIKPRKEKDKAA